MEIGAAANAKTSPDRTAIVFGAVRYTWREWNARMCRLAHALRGLGLERGDKIAVLLHNCHQFLEFGNAAQKVALVPVPLNYRLRAREIEYIMNNSDAKALVFGEEFAPEILPIMDELGGVAPGGYVVVGAPPDDRFTDYETFIADQPETEPPDPPAAGLNSMIYTSGTTGRPKGVFRKGGVDIGLLLGIVQGFGFQMGNEVHIVPAPLYHSAPALGSALTIALGGTLVVMDKFDPEQFLALIDREKVTSSLVVPTILKRVLALPDDVRARYDVSSMRSLVVGAAPFPVETKKATIAYFGHCLYEYYGSTDAGLNTILSPAEQIERPTSCGKVLAGHDIKILDDEGKEVAGGEVGNIYITNSLV